MRRLLSSRLLHPQARRAGRRLLPRTTAEVWAAASCCAAAAAGAAAAASQSSEKPGTSAVQSLVRFSSTEEHRRLEDDYELGEEIGRGHFATVRRARHRETGEVVAVKQIASSRRSKSGGGGAAKRPPSEVRREVEIMRLAGRHRNIVELRGVYETEGGWALVMEYVGGGELFDRLVQYGAYSEQQASALFRQVGEAIAHLHALGVCHRDLKPENLLLSGADQRPGGEGEGEQPPLTIKVCDLGLAAHLEASQDRQGTWAYWAPECFTATRGSGREVAGDTSGASGGSDAARTLA